MSRAEVAYNSDGSVTLSFPYDADFIDELKGNIPPSMRKWDPTLKCWWVRREYSEVAEELITDRWEDADVVRGSRAGPRYEPAKPGGSTVNGGLYAKLFVLPTAPDCVLDAAYRALAKVHHTDVGGKGERMLELNQAYDAIKKLRERA